MADVETVAARLAGTGDGRCVVGWCAEPPRRALSVKTVRRCFTCGRFVCLACAVRHNCALDDYYVYGT